MKAILVPVGGFPRTAEVDGLRDMQEAVHGCIEPCSWVFGDAPAVYVNESGKFDGSEPNRAVYATTADAGCVRWDGTAVHEGDLLDVLYGDFICVGFDPESGENRDVTDEETERVRERFGTRWSVESGFLEAFRMKLAASIANR